MKHGPDAGKWVRVLNHSRNQTFKNDDAFGLMKQVLVGAEEEPGLVGFRANEQVCGAVAIEVAGGRAVS